MKTRECGGQVKKVLQERGDKGDQLSCLRWAMCVRAVNSTSETIGSLSGVGGLNASLEKI